MGRSRIPQPTSAEEFEQRFEENSKATGAGFDAVQHFPCPFCAAPDFYVMKALDFEAESGELTCVSCERTAEWVTVRERNGVRGEFEQRGGDEPPEWFERKQWLR